MTNEKNDNSVKLFRKPKPPKLKKLDITNALNPYDKDSSAENTERSVDSFPSTDQETVASSNYLSTFVNKKFISAQYNQMLLPILNYNTKINTTPSSMRTNNNKDKLINIPEEYTNKRHENHSECDCTIPPSSISSIDELYKKIESGPNGYLKKINNSKFKSSMPTIKSRASTEERVAPFVTKLYSSTTFQSKSLVRPFKMLGPDPLPIRPVKHNNDILVKKSFYEDFTYENYDANKSNQVHDFKLNDFFRDSTVNQNIIDTKYSLLSTHNYNQICKLLAEKIEQEKAEFYDSKNVNTIKVIYTIPDTEN